MPTTSNFGWTTPADTDLVKDGAAAIRTLGNGVDASFVDLKGGTTGQVLSKASNTDLDFTWSAADPLSILDAKGDLISATAADTPARLAVGTNGQYLQADSSTATGLKWATVSSGGMTELASGNLPTNASTITLSSISGSYKSLRLIIRGACNATATGEISLRFNSDSSGLYQSAASTATGLSSASDFTEFDLQLRPIASSTLNNSVIDIPDYSQTVSHKTVNALTFFQDGATTYALRNIRGSYRSTSAISSITIFEEGAYNFSSGSYILYGVS